MYFIDTHTHLFLEEFETDRKSVIEKAINLGVEKMILPNVDTGTLEQLHAVCRINPRSLFPAIGLHPCSVKTNYNNELAFLKDALKNGKYCAIGEIGIDLYWDKTFYKEQVLALEEQIHWALDYNLPVILHSRESFDQIYNVIKKYKGLRGVFHAFTGDEEHLEKISNIGFFFGIGGIATFKNSGLDKVIPKLQLNKIILETDAPYLAPVPYRGKRNEPAYIINIAEKLSDIFNISIEKIANITSSNAESLFKI